MVATREKKVGRFKVKLDLANFGDITAVERGYLEANKIRRVKVDGVVDSGAAYLVLPTAVARQLGLQAVKKVKVKYANNSVAWRDKVQGVHLELQGRDGVFMATLEPKRDTALIGALVLEELDFLIDAKKSKLYPRDPESVLAEIE
jgi:predicted aspartyl protease